MHLFMYYTVIYGIRIVLVGRLMEMYHEISVFKAQPSVHSYY